MRITLIASAESGGDVEDKPVFQLLGGLTHRKFVLIFLENTAKGFLI